MKCEDARNWLVAYGKGELDGPRKAGLETHLAQCAGCSQELEKLRRVLAITQLADDETLVEAASNLIQTAIERSASDIHIEPQNEGDIRVRFRIDGLLQEYEPQPPFSKESALALVARFKMMADCDVENRRAPQDGRIDVHTADGKDFDLRVSFLPSIQGESVVMRVLDRSRLFIGLDRLGFLPDMQNELEKLTEQPNGIIIVCGPNSSGRTTTVYSILQKINRPGTKILTIEDPVEYALPGAVQVHVNRKEGLSFAVGLRAVMRQDPDVIMVGEQRDMETIELVIQASLTGHLVLTCMHTSNAPAALARLMDVGVDSFLLASSVIGILAQRLARRICPHCKVEYMPKSELLASLRADGRVEDENPVLFRGAGCGECRNSGYKGRLGIFELLVVDEAMKDLVIRHGSTQEIRQAAINAGMRTLREDALEKVLQGLTTPEEALRVVFGSG
ncbi:MAG: Flp pilus assembly complex ATPase component TadA [Armatimonadota bacterium]|nr:Flp pilus assembly complex ATPase component TadA [Armatimonadota bacterium]